MVVLGIIIVGTLICIGLHTYFHKKQRDVHINNYLNCGTFFQGHRLRYVEEYFEIEIGDTKFEGSLDGPSFIDISDLEGFIKGDKEVAQIHVFSRIDKEWHWFKRIIRKYEGGVMMCFHPNTLKDLLHLMSVVQDLRGTLFFFSDEETDIDVYTASNHSIMHPNNNHRQRAMCVELEGIYWEIGA